MKRPRRPNDTEEAIDKAVDSAANAVERRLDHEGIARPRVTPRDVLRSRYPRDTIDEEEVTEQMSDEEPFARRSIESGDYESITTPMSIPTPAPMPIAALPPPPVPPSAPVLPPPAPPPPSMSVPTPPAIRARRSGSGHASLSPISVGPRSSRPPAPPGPRPAAHVRHAAQTSSPKPRGGRSKTFFSRAPSAPWILALITLGGVTAFATVMAVRSPGFIPSDSARSRAAGAGPEVGLPDSGVAAPFADAAAPSASAATPPATNNKRPRR